MKKRKVLITGANGFLAGSTIKQLYNKGYNVVATSIENKPIRKLPQDIEYVSADLTDKKSVDQLFKGRNIEDIIHHAALFSLSAPSELLHKVNVQGTENLLDYGIEHGAEKAIVTSSGTVYSKGNHKRTEWDMLGPVEIYGESKLKQEIATKNRMGKRTKNGKFECGIIRPAVILGNESRYGGAVALFTHYLVQSLFQGIKAVPKDGLDELCFIHVNDCAALHIYALENNWVSSFENDYPSFIFNAVDKGFSRFNERPINNIDLANIVFEELNLPWYRSMLKDVQLSLPEKPLKWLSKYNDKGIQLLKKHNLPVPTVSLDGGSVDLMFAGNVSMSAQKSVEAGFQHKHPYSNDWIRDIVKHNINSNWENLIGSKLSNLLNLIS